MLRTILGVGSLAGLALGQTAPEVDLGYAVYQGTYSAQFDQNLFYGIRFAAPPARWQLPTAPVEDRSQVFPATSYAPICPQVPAAPSSFGQPSGSEDCLFLNVQAPAGKTGLPVMVWIHGGGYGGGSAQMEWENQIVTNGNSFVVVTIQYRLGAFGFLSSADLVANGGVPNVGLHDQRFALQWVKDHIDQFGGDPTKVTIYGESAGGGSVMLQAMANGGSEGDALFSGIIPASPYLPTQWNYDGDWPETSYNKLLAAAGCSSYSCLANTVDSGTLQQANNLVNSQGDWGQWTFIPVTDGTLIQKLPSEQLTVDKNVNGNRVLVGNNGNEGVLFTPQNITTQEDFEAFVLTNYPDLSEANLTSILALYTVPENYPTVLEDSNGLTAPFSTSNSEFAVGWQQAANNLYAESTFVCPSYWLADAYGGVEGKSSWKYQYSVTPALHGADLEPLYDPYTTTGTGTNAVFRVAVQWIWGNFITAGDPTLTTAQNGPTDGGNITAAVTGVWSQWGGSEGKDWMLNLNMTGGSPVVTQQTVDGVTIDVVSYVDSNGVDPPLKTDFSVVEGYSWEDGRGARCQLWADLGPWAMM